MRTGKSNKSDYLTPAELRWMMSKRDPSEKDYDLLMRCLGSMTSNLDTIQKLRAELKRHAEDSECRLGVRLDD